MGIIEDFLRIKDYLELSDEMSLEIQFHHSEGFYFSNQNRIMIGIKDGYNRRLLVHESLHATGLTHYKPPSYSSVVSLDIYSAKIEEEIFGAQTLSHKANNYICQGRKGESPAGDDPE